ncbi:MAG: hypothetical protein ACHQUC_03435 [Chlamydiales bacterium]
MSFTVNKNQNILNQSNDHHLEVPKGIVAARRASYSKLEGELRLSAKPPEERFRDERQNTLSERKVVVLDSSPPSPTSTEESASESTPMRLKEPIDLAQAKDPTPIREASTLQKSGREILRVEINPLPAQGQFGRMATAVRHFVNKSSFNDVVRYFAALGEDELTTTQMVNHNSNRALKRLVIKTVPSGEARAAIITNLARALRYLQYGNQEEAKTSTIAAIKGWEGQQLKNNRHRSVNAVAIRNLAVEWANGQSVPASLPPAISPVKQEEQRTVKQEEERVVGQDEKVTVGRKRLLQLPTPKKQQHLGNRALQSMEEKLLQQSAD